jgi:hypothetical protein
LLSVGLHHLSLFLDDGDINNKNNTPHSVVKKRTPQPIIMSNPMFTSDYSGGRSGGTAATLNLDDIFGDVMFTPDGDTVFMSEEQDALASGEARVTTMATKIRPDGRVQKVKKGGGLYTTQLHDTSKPSLVMGSAGQAPETKAVPFQKAPQERHHLQYAMPKKKSSRTSDRKMSEQQKSERR